MNKITIQIINKISEYKSEYDDLDTLLNDYPYDLEITDGLNLTDDEYDSIQTELFNWFYN